MKYRLRCVTCAREFDADPRASTCPHCGPFDGTLDVIYHFDLLPPDFPKELCDFRGRSVFESFSPILPFSSRGNLPPLPIGDTPFFRSRNLSRRTGMTDLWIKDDGRNPSASLKDRASAVAIAMAKEAGISTIATASTGNAASSLATLAASASMMAVLFVPRDAPRPKLAQIMIHGGRVLRLDCDYDAAFDLCEAACKRFGWYNRNTAVNPFTGEGKKTAALEIARDLSRAPDAVICPVGDGCIIGGMHKGFGDLLELGLVKHMPRLYGVQAEGANPVVRAFESGSPIIPLEHTHTFADSISVGHPRDGVKALRAARDTGGAMLAVSDEEISEAQKMLACGGVFAEPAAAASFAGLLRLVDEGTIGRNDTAVILITGHGLKDVDSVLRSIPDDSRIVEPRLESIEIELADILK